MAPLPCWPSEVPVNLNFEGKTDDPLPRDGNLEGSRCVPGEKGRGSGGSSYQGGCRSVSPLQCLADVTVGSLSRPCTVSWQNSKVPMAYIGRKSPFPTHIPRDKSYCLLLAWVTATHKRFPRKERLLSFIHFGHGMMSK